MTGDPTTRTFTIDKNIVNWALAGPYALTVTPILRDDTILTGSKAIYSLTLVDPCKNPTITPSALGPLTYELDGSGTVQATYPEFIVTPSYCLKGYQIDIPARVESAVVTADASTRTFTIDKNAEHSPLAGTYNLNVTPILRDDTLATNSKAIYSLTLTVPFTFRASFIPDFTYYNG